MKPVLFSSCHFDSTLYEEPPVCCLVPRDWLMDVNLRSGWPLQRGDEKMITCFDKDQNVTDGWGSDSFIIIP